MKYIILLAGILFCLVRIAQGIRERQTQRRIIEAEKQREADAARLREEWRREQAQYKANLLRVQALEKEQALARKQREALLKEQDRQRREQERVRREQDRQRREQERQAKEQERQAAILERHEAEIRKAEFNFRQMKREWEFLENRLAQQEAMRDSYLKQQEGMEPGTKEYDTMQRKLIVLENQIHQTKTKYNKAVFQAKEAQRKVS